MTEQAEKHQDKRSNPPTESDTPSESEAVDKVVDDPPAESNTASESEAVDQSNQLTESKALDGMVGALKEFESILLRQELAQEQKSMVAEVTKAIGATAERLAAARHTTVGSAHGESSPCCECVSSACCCFEIVAASVRATQPQLEPGDSGDIVGFANPLEVRIFFAVDGIGVVWPNLWSTMQLRVGTALLGGKPGPWTDFPGKGLVIGKVCLPKGESREIPVTFDAIESDAGFPERLVHMKDEFGSAAGSLTLDCAYKKVYPAKPAVLRFSHGGTGGGQAGEIEIAFRADRVC